MCKRSCVVLLLLLSVETFAAPSPYSNVGQSGQSTTVLEPSNAPPSASDAQDSAVTAASSPVGSSLASFRGQEVFRVNCAFCHGSDGRGGEGGPNLLRSPLVLNDQKGEVLAAVVLNGRPDKGMPKFELSMDTVANIAAYLHSVGASPDHGSVDPKDILVGNAGAGKAYFYGRGRCNGCHSIQGDLAGIGSKYDPKTLQDNLISGGTVGQFGTLSAATPPRTVSVTLGTGLVIKGTLIAIDDFAVSLMDDTGRRRSIRRHGDSPAIDVVDPRQAHLDRLRQWDDRDIHNLTAFLVQQK